MINRLKVSVILAFYTLIVLLLANCSVEKPVITRLDPNIAEPGEYLTIYGEGFGGSRGESYVSIGGTRPTTSS
ncbi:MAG: IPT/TIG domain-containing protein, partial [Spirochaetaceae bacterium]|nr:IPT/TIG domain-containing protein [Spirochaetaceae bacterium]